MSTSVDRVEDNFRIAFSILVVKLRVTITFRLFWRHVALHRLCEFLQVVLDATVTHNVIGRSVNFTNWHRARTGCVGAHQIVSGDWSESGNSIGRLVEHVIGECTTQREARHVNARLVDIVFFFHLVDDVQHEVHITHAIEVPTRIERLSPCGAWDSYRVYHNKVGRVS